MITLLLHLLRLLPFLCGGPRQLALENLALRQQLAVSDWKSRVHVGRAGAEAQEQKPGGGRDAGAQDAALGAGRDEGARAKVGSSQRGGV
jgi:hypothetical protein